MAFWSLWFGEVVKDFRRDLSEDSELFGCDGVDEVSAHGGDMVRCGGFDRGLAFLCQGYEVAALVVRAFHFCNEFALFHSSDLMGNSALLPSQLATKIC